MKTGTKTKATLLAATAVIAFSGVAYSVAADTQPIELNFFSHLDAGMPEQDVFIARSDAQVYRVTADDKDLQAQLFTTANELHHNPFDPSQVGPHQKGADLGLNLGEWLGAKGSGTYECEGESGVIDVTFAGLIPDGVYTMWHFFMPMPVIDPFIGTLDLPYGARDGSEATFAADGQGTASFAKTTESCLQLSGTQTVAGLAIAYHSDGNTYGAVPGEFGKNAHIQLFTMLPN